MEVFNSAFTAQDLENAIAGASPVLEELSITENGEYLPSEGVDGFSKVVANIPTGGDTADTSFKDVIERTATEVTLPSDLEKIGDNAFADCYDLTSVSIPSGVKSIGTRGFATCRNLTVSTFPTVLTSIGSYAFVDCYKLTSISFPAGLTSIESYAFQNCIGLSEVTFEGKPNSIKTNPFNYCTKLLTINVPWAEGEVSGAPWGATNATINYNHTGG